MFNAVFKSKKKLCFAIWYDDGFCYIMFPYGRFIYNSYFPIHTTYTGLVIPAVYITCQHTSYLSKNALNFITQISFWGLKFKN